MLPIYGNCFEPSCLNLQSVIVTDTASDTRVEGHVELVQNTLYQGLAYFVPTTPFRSGVRYDVSTGESYARSPVVGWVNATEPAELGEGSLKVTAALTKVQEVTDRRCCSSCIDVSVVSSLALTTRLSAEQASATQYLFELSMHAKNEAGSVVDAFSPLFSEYYAVPMPVYLGRS